jgi:thiamine pyrophosphate-dependent acetolactate synthase large subunit-like protein
MLGGLAEFNTAVRHGIDLVVVVCNDGSYGAEYRKLQARDFGVEVSLFDWPEFAPVASALGGTGLTVRTTVDLRRLGTVIADRDRPVLIDLKLDPAQVT